MGVSLCGNGVSLGCAGSTTILSVINGPYTATGVNGLSVYNIYNNTGAPFTFTLPANPAANSMVIIVDAALTAGAHLITIQGNGKPIVAYGLSQSNIGINSNGGSVVMGWDGAQWTQYA